MIQLIKNLGLVFGSYASGYRVQSRWYRPEWKKLANDQWSEIRTDRIEDLFARTKDSDLRGCLIHAFADEHLDPTFFDAWVLNSSQCGDAYLLRGAYQIQVAWKVRSGKQAQEVSSDAWPVFHAKLQEAVEDLQRAASLLPNDPLPYANLILAMTGLGQRESVKDHFQNAIQRKSDCWDSHFAMLMHLCRKWGGSHEEMLGFARQRSKAMLRGHALTALIAEAHFEKLLYIGNFDKNETAAEQYRNHAQVKKELMAAYQYGIGSPKHKEGIRTLAASNAFAHALHLFGLFQPAQREFDRIGKSPAEFPWRHYGLASVSYFEFRRENASKVA